MPPCPPAICVVLAGTLGIGFVLIIWAVVGFVLASVGAVVFGTATALATLEVQHGRRRAMLAASLFAFVCLGWAALIFIFQALVNEGLLHRDPGAGGAWACPLPNGYALL